MMSVLHSDTHPQMESQQIQLWRQASPTRKMEMLAQLNQLARTLAPTRLRAQFPEADESELRLKSAELTLGGDLAHRVYGKQSRAE